MEAYTDFAETYDHYMEELPYELWVDFTCEMLKLHGIDNGLVAELGCGTGHITGLMADAGYDMIGIDNSVEMLSVARSKESDAERILYLEQDMTEFELYGTVRAVISLGDSINYLTEEGDMQKTFKLVNNYLDPGGIFIFDLKTEHLFRDIMGEKIRFEDSEKGSLIWENSYDSESRINEYSLTGYRRTEWDEELFIRFDEVHYQKACSLREVKQELKAAGLLFIGAYELVPDKEGWSTASVTAKTERMHIICKSNK